MPPIALRPATVADIDPIVALNAAVVAVTSPMDHARCAELLALASHALVAEQAGTVIGFMLAMAPGDAYANANFAWFGERLRRFAYIDRVVIAAKARGGGVGGRIYDDLARRARAQDALLLAAEMDLDPPNHASLAFHAGRGFVPIGTRRYDDGKVVSMQVCALV
jgi:predicted GNAT superfamily acetyltransferase